MTLPVAIVDTNVLVSGLLTSEPEAPTAVIVDAMLAGEFPYLLSVELLGEYRRVLSRPRIMRRHGLNDAEVDVLLTELTLNAVVRDVPPTSTTIPDAGDRHLWALLESDSTAVLVTGDEALLKHAAERDRVLSPRRFVALLERRRR